MNRVDLLLAESTMYLMVEVLRWFEVNIEKNRKLSRLKPDGYLVGKELVILRFDCVVGKCFVVLYVFSFPPTVYVG